MKAALILLALALGALTGTIASGLHVYTATTTVSPTNSTTSSPINTTTTTVPYANVSMAQNATCVAAYVHIVLSEMFYSRVFTLANATGELKLVNANLALALNFTREANETYSKGLCFTALKEAIEAIHMEQAAWRILIVSIHREFANESKLLGRVEVTLRKLEIAYRIANETGNETLESEISKLINETKYAARLISMGNLTKALRLINGVEHNLTQILKSVHKESKVWAEKRAASHGKHGSKAVTNTTTKRKSKGESNNGKHGH